MHPYRTHTCGALRASHSGERVRLSGWIHRKRDHGQLLFIDLRDAFGLTQCVIDVSSPLFATLEEARPESVLTVTGPVVPREEETVNPSLPTGEVEVRVAEAIVQAPAALLPLQVNAEEDAGEEIRLRYRYLDLRREKMARRIHLRSAVINSIRRRMVEQGFTEFQTPILTASSPEGARDYLVPSRVHPGKFYALPQAPQMFKQLLMIAGFDRYFQIAPCFRDEDSRADRSPGEFYQLDFEMSFVTQEDVFAAIEPVLAGVFEEFADGRQVTAPPFPRIPFEQAMLLYGTDKPDLRNPIEIADVTEAFRGSGFGIFARAVEQGAVVRAIPASAISSTRRAARPRVPSPRTWMASAWRRSRRRRVCAMAMASSSPATRKKPRRSSPGSCATAWGGTSISWRRIPFGSAGWSISRCMSATRRPVPSSSPTTPFPCRKADCKRWRQRTRLPSRLFSTISSATGSSFPRGRSETTCRKSCTRPSPLPAMPRPRSRRVSAGC
jgi:aspartyl-tRNA synthetase